MDLIQPELFGDPVASKAAAEEAIQRVEDNAEPEWKEEALDAIYFLAKEFPRLTGDQVWLLLESQGVEPPHEPRAMGAIFRQAAKVGYIKPTDLYMPSVRPLDHRGPKRVWESLLWKKD